MSALGQKRTLLVSFDHFVGSDEQARRYCKAKCFRRLKIDDGFVLGWHLHRKIGRLSTAQDTVDIGCPLSRQIDEVSPVIHETARCDENTERVNRGQAMTGCYSDIAAEMEKRRSIARTQ